MILFLALLMAKPVMSGSEAFDGMKDIDPDIKILISSGYDQEGPANQMLKRGCCGFIQKLFCKGKNNDLLEAF